MGLCCIYGVLLLSFAFILFYFIFNSVARPGWFSEESEEL